MAEAEPAPGRTSTALAVEDMHKRFGAVAVLKGVSLAANDHDVVSILGSSGSGKSTLLRCINLLETPDAGRVYVKGELIRMREHGRGATVSFPRIRDRWSGSAQSSPWSSSSSTSGRT